MDENDQFMVETVDESRNRIQYKVEKESLEMLGKYITLSVYRMEQREKENNSFFKKLKKLSWKS